MDNNFAIVFDMDETLGSFGQLYKFWSLTKTYLKNNELHENYFFNIVDMFPLFFRPQLLRILNNIKRCKLSKKCNYVMIYTNNNGPNEWANIIKKYLHYKLKYRLFDQIIRAFKIDGKQIEICRTSHTKSYRDFINCTKLPPTTKVCFLDDVQHKEMMHDNVLYINVEPYHHNEKYENMALQFYNKHKHLFYNLKYASKNDYINFIKLNTSNNNLNALNKNTTQNNIDNLISQQILREINKFLKHKQANTKKRKKKDERKNTTQKN